MTATRHPHRMAERSADIPPGSSGTRARASGFSLLELLVAVTLLALLSALLFRMVDASTKLWRDNERGAEAFREARAALGVISREIGSALVHDATERLPGIVVTDWAGGPLDTAVAGEGNALFFLGLLPAAAQETSERSDLCALGYYLAYTRDPADPDTITDASRKLYRYFSGSNTTFASARTALDPTRSISLPATSWPDAINALFLPRPTDPTKTAQNEPLARNVADFSATLLRTDGGQLKPAASWTRTDWPDAVELKITALTEEAASQLRAEADWDQAAKPPEQQSPLFRRNARTFTTRIFLPGPAAGPLPTPSPTPTPAP